jgi:PAS domain S-box-containing protein
MKEEHKTREQLMDELVEMRQRTAELEASEAERKQAEEELAWERYLLKTLMDNVPDAIYFKDTGSRFIRTNRAHAERWFGLSDPAQAVGKTDFDFFSEDHARQAYEDEQEIIRAGQPLLNMEERETWPDRPDTWVLTSKMPLRDEKGEIIGTFGITRDITARKRAEEKIEHLNLVLRAIRNVNQLITRERDRDRLLQDACETLIETRGYHSAWIALLNESGGPVLSGAEGPVTTAEAGLGEDFLPLVEQLKHGELTDCGQRALKQSGVVVTEDPASTCADCPLSSMYNGMGAVTIRLEYGGKVYGLLSVSIPRDLAADEEEQGLFEEVAGDIAFALHSIELEEEAQTRAEELAVLNEMGRALTAMLDVDAVVENIYHHASRLIDTTNFYVALYDPEQDMVSFPLYVEGERRLERESRRARKGLTEHIIRTREALLIEDNIPARQEELGVENLGTPGAESWLGVPMIIGDQMLGVIAVQSYTTPWLYDERDRDLLTAIANQAAVALENARLFEDTKRRLAQLTALQETTQAVASTLELDKLLNLITQQATALFQGSGGIINLVDWENQEDEVAVASGAAASALGWRSSLEGNLSGWVALHNQPVISNQLPNDDRVDSRVRSGKLLMKSAAIAPLTIKDQVVGTLVVQDKQGGKGKFDQADLDLLVAFANQAATAIENARLYEELTEELAERERAEEALKRRMEQLAALSQMSQAVTASLELDQVLAEIVSLASKVVASDYTTVVLMDEAGKIGQSAENLPGVPAIEYRVREKGLTSWIVRSRQAVVIDEIGEDGAISPDLGEGAPRFVSRPIVEAGIKSCACLPLMVKGQLLGVLHLHSVRPHALDDQLPLLTTFANQVAIAIENARLFEQTKAALEALRVSEERFALAVRGSNDGIWDWDIRNNTLYWSPRLKELLGYADDELDIDFDTFDSLLHPDDKEHTNVAIEAHLKDRGLYSVEQRLRTKSGKYRWFRARGQALWDEAGNPIRMVGSSTDITERKAAEEALKEYSDRLEEMVEERTQELRDAQEQLVRREKLAVLGQLAGGVGHELRNPLGAISNAAYFLNMVLEEPEPDVKETLDILEKEVKTSERIISSLLDFARAKPPTRRKVDINEVVQEALSRATVPGNVEVVSQLDEALPIILADPGQLAQVFGNIILNAIQAMPEGGRLLVKSEIPTPEWVAVSFADTGAGIPEENLGKLFEPLFTTKAKGIGLGLAVTKTLVEGHEGTIEVQSELGKGSTFTIRLPVDG